MAPPVWLPLESNPDVMNEFMAKSGMEMSEYKFVDVYGLDEDTLAFLKQPIAAFILLYPSKSEDNKGDESKKVEETKDVYYAKQSISNACGTVAMIHAVGNNMEKLNFKDDAPIKAFIEKTKDLSPSEKAEQLEGDEALGAIHDEMAKSGQTSAPALGDQVEHHFVTFVLRNGAVWELDGRKEGPIKVSEGVDETSFGSEAAKACKAYMEKAPGTLDFSIIALTPA